MAGDTAVHAVDMNVKSVDETLDSVRPYLMADGGNVTVVDVQQGVVFLRLEVGGPAVALRPRLCLPDRMMCLARLQVLVAGFAVTTLHAVSLVKACLALKLTVSRSAGLTACSKVCCSQELPV